MKRCTKCGVEKSLDEFTTNGKRVDGSVKRRSQCKKCCAAAIAKRREEDPEFKARALAQTKAWHVLHREEHREYCKQYYIDNLEELKAKGRAYRAANREAIRERKQKDYWTGRELLRDDSITNRPHVGYRWYWSDGSVAYVGITHRSVEDRTKEHYREAPWYREDIIPPTTYEIEFANRAEGQAWEREQVEAAVERGEYILNDIFNPLR